MTTDRTLRTAKALVWACALASVIIIGIGLPRNHLRACARPCFRRNPHRQLCP